MKYIPVVFVTKFICLYQNRMSVPPWEGSWTFILISLFCFVCLL